MSRLSETLLSHPLTNKLVSLLFSAFFRVWLGTLDYRFLVRCRASNPAWADRPTLFVFWHETLFFPVYTHARFNVATLVSHHRDGEFLAQVLRMLRGKAVRGSTSRHSVSALRKLIRQGRISHLAIAPDGPLGPPRVVQSGAIFLASRTQMPIVPVGFAFEKCWRAKSWDRMALPHPWVRARCVAEEPIEVPTDLARRQIEQYRGKLQATLQRAQALAEFLAAGGKSTQPFLTLSGVQTA